MDDDAITRLERVMEAGFSTLADLIGQTNTRLEQLRADTNDRLDRHEQVLVQLVHGQERHDQILERHEQILVQLVHGQERHEQALGLLIEAVHGLGGRSDNLVSGPLGEKVRDLDRRVTALEARASG